MNPSPFPPLPGSLLPILAALLTVAAVDKAGSAFAAPTPALPPPPEPQSPAREQASFELSDPALVIELVAAEPNVSSPVAIAWDGAARMYVAEMRDYPNAASGGSIRLLEDRDGDGRYETSRVFADALPFPNGVLPWRDGLLVTAAPDILFMKDNDGDGRADERRVIATGFGTGNQQLRVNGLFWGIDNWVYGANGRSDGDVAMSGDATGSRHSLRGRDFRFKPMPATFETLAGRSQFGLATDDWGNRFLSWNTVPIRHEVFPDRFLQDPSTPVDTDVLHDLLPPDDTGEVFPRTPSPLVFNNESSAHFNALAGLTVFRGDRLGIAYQGNAFVGESLRNLVHRRMLVPEGESFRAEVSTNKAEFLAATDPCFHPVHLSTGPDGALYVADFYRVFVEHPDWVPAHLRNAVDWRTAGNHGRIWRIRLRDRPPGTSLRLDRATTAALVGALEDPNGWVRDTAQRLLVERNDDASHAPLIRLAASSSKPATRLQALHTLDGLHALTGSHLAAALQDPHPRVREGALRLCAERWPASRIPAGIAENLLALASDPDPRVQLWSVLAGIRLDPEPCLELLATVIRNRRPSPWMSGAIAAAARPLALPLLDRLFREIQSTESPALESPSTAVQKTTDEQRAARLLETPSQIDLLEKLAAAVFRPGESVDVRRLIRLERRARTLPAVFDRAWPAIMTGFASSLSKSGASILDLPDWISPSHAASADGFRNHITACTRLATDPHAPLELRRTGLRFCESTTIPHSLASILREEPPPQRSSASGAASAFRSFQHDAALLLAKSAPASQLDALVKDLNGVPQSVQSALLAAAAARRPAAEVLLTNLESRHLAWTRLEPATRDSLRRTLTPPDRQRLEGVVGTHGTDRAAIVAQYRSALDLAGNSRHGGELFAQNCQPCHAAGAGAHRVGPDLAGIASRPREALLIDLLDPSREVAPDFSTFEVVLQDGETLSGLIAGSTTSSVRLRRAGLPDLTLLRKDVIDLRSTGRSLMPDGLESALTPQDLADLLAHLTKSGQ